MDHLLTSSLILRNRSTADEKESIEDKTVINNLACLCLVAYVSIHSLVYASFTKSQYKMQVAIHAY